MNVEVSYEILLTNAEICDFGPVFFFFRSLIELEANARRSACWNGHIAFANLAPVRSFGGSELTANMIFFADEP